MSNNDKLKALYTSFPLFVALVWKVIGLPKPTELQVDIAKTLQNPPNNRFIIQGFRGVAKSFITCAYVVWVLWREPNTKIMIVSASKERADANASFIKKIIAELPFLSHLKAREGQRDTQNLFDVGPALPDHSPSVKSVGITGQLTGSRADIIVCDDVETTGNCFTQTMRDRLFELVKEMDSILKPGDDKKILYLGTPQNEMSLYNELQERGYTTYIWPARYPYDDRHRQSYGDKLAPYLAARYDANPKLAGKPTDPRRFDEEDLQKRELSYRKAGFMLQFMLDTSLSDADKYPLKLRDLIVGRYSFEKGPMSIEWIPDPSKTISNDDAPVLGLKGDRYFGHHSVSPEVAPYGLKLLVIDPSGRGQDETGYSILYYLNGFIYVMDVGGLKGGYSDETLTKLARLAKQWKVNEVVIEGNFGDGMYLKLFEPVLFKHHRATLTEVKSKGQKEVRIIDTLEPVMSNHKLIVHTDAIRRDFDSVPEGDYKYSCFYQMTRLTAERGALVHDDRLDALAIGVGYLVDIMNVDANKAIESKNEKWLMDAYNSIYNSRTTMVGGFMSTDVDNGVGVLEGISWV